MNSSIMNSSILDEYIKRFKDMTTKLDVVEKKDDINDVIRFTGIFLKAAEQRKKVIDKNNSKKKSKMYQSKAEREAEKKEADKNNNSDSSAPVTSSETPAPDFNYTG